MQKKFLILIFIFAVLLIGQAALATTGYGLEGAAKEAGIKQIILPTLIGNVIGAGLSLIGVVFFALMIYGGFLWMTAHGKEEQAKQGLETALAAVIGLIIILAAYAITSFVFSSVGTTGGGSAPPKTEENVAMSCGAAPGTDDLNLLCGQIYQTESVCPIKFCVGVLVMNECTASAGETVDGFCAQFKTVETCEVEGSMQKQFCMWKANKK